MVKLSIEICSLLMFIGTYVFTILYLCMIVKSKRIIPGKKLGGNVT